MAWIQTTNLRQDGTPVTRRIKIPDMNRAIWFTDKGYAEITDSVATLLVNNIDSIQSTTEPTDPGTYYGDVGSQQEMTVIFPRDDRYVDDLNATTVTAQTAAVGDVRAETAEVTNNVSMRERLPRTYQGAAVTTDGTHYALSHDGTDLVLYRGSDPSSLTERYRWAGATDTLKRTVHITRTGTILATGIGGSIERSTDGGQTFTSAGTFGATIWTMTENAAGSILASHSGPAGTVALYRSTDDGATWTQIADGTTFPEFSRHIHRVRYHPVNDYIIVTGGDANTTGFYRSADGGTTWNYYDPLGVQWVGICPHPTDGSKYLLGGDDMNWGPIAMVTDDGTNVSATPLLETTLERSPPNAMGSFDISCVHDPAGESNFVLSGTGDADPRIWASDDLEANSWRNLGKAHIPNPDHLYIGDQTTGAGPYESIVDPSTADSLIIGGTRVSTRGSSDHHYGSDSEKSVDERRTHGHIQMNSGDQVRYDRGFARSDFRHLLTAAPSDGNVFQLSYLNGNVQIRNGTTGANLRFDVDNARLNLNGWRFQGLRVLANAGVTDLVVGEQAIDTNRGGLGATALLYKGSDGLVRYWEADGTL